MKAIQFLVDNGCDVSLRSSEGGHALLAACVTGLLKPAELFVISLNRDTVNMCVCEERGGNSPLLVAILHGHHDIAEMLIANGADVNHANTHFATPLNYLCGQVCEHPYMLPLVNLLLEHGADFKICDQSMISFLICEAELGLHEVVASLLSAGADPRVVLSMLGSRIQRDLLRCITQFRVSGLTWSTFSCKCLVLISIECLSPMRTVWQ